MGRLYRSFTIVALAEGAPPGIHFKERHRAASMATGIKADEQLVGSNSDQRICPGGELTYGHSIDSQYHYADEFC